MESLGIGGNCFRIRLIYTYIPPEREPIRIWDLHCFRPPMQQFRVTYTNMLVSKKPHGPNSHPNRPNTKPYGSNVTPNASSRNMVLRWAILSWYHIGHINFMLFVSRFLALEFLVEYGLYRDFLNYTDIV